MKFEYERFFVEGSPDEILAKMNEYGADGWEVVHVTDMNRESHILTPICAVLVKREVASSKKHG